jgi:hypothetical protein
MPLWDIADWCEMPLWDVADPYGNANAPSPDLRRANVTAGKSVGSTIDPPIVYGGGRNCGKTMRRVQIDFGSEEGQRALQASWRDGAVFIGEFETVSNVKCGRCAQLYDGIKGFQAHICLSDAELAQGRKIQSLFDQQQKRGSAYFIGCK